MDTCICKEVIISTIKRRGTGGPHSHSPVRVITGVFDKDGTLIAEKDPLPDKFNEYHLQDFVKWCIKSQINPDNIDYAINKWKESFKAG